MKGSKFVFYFVDGIFYKMLVHDASTTVDHKCILQIGLKIKDQQKIKKNNDNRYFQYLVAITLNHEGTRVHP